MNKHLCFPTPKISTENAFLGNFVDSLPWPVITIGDDGRISRLSRPVPGKLAPEDIVGQSYFPHVFPEYFAALQGHAPWFIEQRADLSRETPDGTVHESLFMCRIMHNACLIIMDQTQQATVDAANAQTSRLAALGFMVAGVCHEVSNPVASIHSMVQILRSDRNITPALLEKGLTNIANNVKRLLDISRRLLGFGRVGEEPRCVLPVDTLIAEAFAIAMQGKSVEHIDLRIEADAGSATFGSSSQLQEVFVNVFENGYQAMDGKGRFRISIRRQDNQRIIVAIRDSGPGISLDALPRLFEPFFTTKLPGLGSGLGLAISNEILFEHDGLITAENNAERGACFRIDLPLYKGNS